MLTEQEKMFMIEEIAKDMVCLLIEEKGMTMREALIRYILRILMPD